MSAVLARMNELHAQAIKPASDAYVAALKAMREADDPDVPAIEAVIALDALKGAASEAEVALRELVRDSMSESGVTGFEAGAYEVVRVSPRPAATVTDLAALQAAAPELFETQPDKLNRTELTKRLRNGATLPGAVLGNGGPGHIAIRAAKR